MRKPIFCIAFLLLGLNANAQFTQTNTIDASDIKNLQLNLDEVFAVEIQTGNFSNIEIISEAEGEYAEELQLEIKQIEETLYVNSLFDAILSSGFDKLSSHKVFAIQLKVKLPEKLQLSISSNIAEVHLNGTLTYFDANLKSGNCYLQNFQGNAKVNTYRGNINVETQAAQIDAETRNGNLEVEEAIYKKHIIELKSIEGDIHVIQLN
ncbi:DUF4097 family beta strand repeat-containing protein [Psychroflexus salis]|uniref:Adhesin n=1 Tax=Psychroflexus salis TaxID=1526574 RepID=A0A917E663_9FLAO|nr:DUF4097 family beta strand repeat-containing protein [Psychroflexus salis]GGE08622.1 hypothetical protein GCM10010831_07740 [Psychroflexus salis]